MGLKIGIVGLPNVGKSTLFNALTRQQALAANYPFATIDPNVGVVAVPDERLDKPAVLEQSKKIVPTAIEFVDIAGLVKNAHAGEGLGNQFLSHIREVDAIAQVVRVFQDAGIHHVDGSVNPGRDMETVRTELLLADLATAEKRLTAARSEAKSGEKTALLRASAMEKIVTALAAGVPAREVSLTEDEAETVRDLRLLSSKPIIYVANVDQASLADQSLPSIKLPNIPDSEVVYLDAKTEAELSQLSEEEKREYLRELGMSASGLDQLARTAYKALGLITFLTTGPDETRAWTVRVGASAPEAAGIIHTDFEKGFIKAETIQWTKLLEAGSWPSARERGWIRTEGREYVVQDGDVMFFKFNV